MLMMPSETPNHIHSDRVRKNYHNESSFGEMRDLFQRRPLIPSKSHTSIRLPFCFCVQDVCGHTIRGYTCAPGCTSRVATCTCVPRLNKTCYSMAGSTHHCRGLSVLACLINLTWTSHGVRTAVDLTPPPTHTHSVSSAPILFLFSLSLHSIHPFL